MHWSLIQRWLLASVCILLSGCTVWNNALRTTRFEPSLFSHKHDRRRSMAIYRGWAEEAWQQAWQSAPELGERPDYAQGFRDGFVDYTFAGGTGEPPAVPPRKLWNVFDRSEDGHQRAADWFAGYRHGARISRDGGYRSLSTLNSALLGYHESDRGGIDFAPEMSAEFGRATDDEPPAGETLPLPVSPTPDATANESANSTTSPPADEVMPTQPADGLPEASAPEALPSAIPRELDLPEANELDDGPSPESMQERELDLDDHSTTRAAEPANPATTLATSNAVEHVPLTIPDQSVTPEVPATDTGTPEPSSTPERSSSSVQFIRVAAQ